MDRLPQLRGVQAFVVAAKHLSFKKAADELNVTPTAISHNIKSLEEELGVKLFNRLTRSLSLTNEGKAFAPLATEAFLKLHEAVNALSVTEGEGPLVVTTTKSFAANWLAKRAHRFSNLYPQYNLKIDASDKVREITSNNVDIAIRHGKGSYEGSHFAWILNNFVVPVCSPRMFTNRADAKLKPEELLEFPLIVYEWTENQDADDPTWEMWFDLSGTASTNANFAETYSEEYICLQAALDCRGIALCSTVAASSYLESGELIIPTNVDYFLKDKSFYLVCEKSHASKQKIVAFQDWLLDEADRYRDSPAASLIDTGGY
ncbi:LysR family transcriptional regulator [uncultured Pseudoteredinibacter sp.]|uniref:LysR family transcriptional regulator n=1 Tax=uncultured Pseudoteredinibacter sp. TaxID=1641701 RepID=UPI002630822B|nr:LysR family transcriptional regulator [uncultured Pseudoteredinibacter sp.]